MKLTKIMERGGSEYHDYKKALKMAKKGIESLCDLTKEMEDEYSDWDEDDEDYDERNSKRTVRRVR